MGKSRGRREISKELKDGGGDKERVINERNGAIRNAGERRMQRLIWNLE